jgi:uncharacterized protein YyaL (SSP411 family)
MNRFTNATSPYLLQHRTNPVEWYPWGVEAFAAAREQNKPIFLSVGYSTCHWCHVMARESFSNPETAAIMNEHFINIKVDREERPDVDQVYMTFVQATTGSGGWPMSVWLTPELKPFYGGTYFPPQDAYGRPGFPSVLEHIADAWEKDAAGIREASQQAVSQLRRLSEAGHGGDLPEVTLAREALENFSQRFDVRSGGFGEAPKFPTPSIHEFLQIKAQRTDPTLADEALLMSINTLRAISRGGIQDHVGGGFHRYAVDSDWRIPHYEKMLYDQAQLVTAFLGAYRLTDEAEFARSARDTLAYVMRDMTHPAGGFYSAEDADSLSSPNAPHKTEGAFYIWTESEIDEILGDRAPHFKRAYGVEADGNAPPGTDPHGELAGTNTLYLQSEANPEFASDLARLRAVRHQRPHPHLDDKILSGWNGLMISAFAVAARDLDDHAYLQAAEVAADFMYAKLYDPERGVLLRSYRDGPAGIDGFASDYAYVIEGLINLYEAGFDHRWLQWADRLQHRMDELFLDPTHGGYFDTTGEDPSVLLRQKDGFDGAEPSPNSTAALNLVRLADMLDQPERREQAAKLFQAFSENLKRLPASAPKMLVALDAYHAKPRQAVIAGDPAAEDTRELLRLANQHTALYQVVLLADGGPGQAFLAEHSEFFQNLTSVENRATLYLCEDFVCQLPVNDLEKAKTLLSTH